MAESTWMTRSIVILIIMICPFTFVQSKPHKRKLKAEKSFRTPLLKNIDKVELLSIESRMGNIEKINETKTFERKDVRQILDVWQKQKYGGGSAAACHQPPYALKFYSKGKNVLFLTICWTCHNLTFLVPEGKQWVYFQSESQAAKMLRAIFKKLSF